MADDFSRAPRSWTAKFCGAFRGLLVGTRRQTSFAVHLVFTLAVVAAAGWLRVSRLEWCLLILCIGVVLSAEMFNSALETLARAIDTQYNRHLADGLDIASAAVLLSAAGAALCGLLILVPRVLGLFQ
jgi:diacylglycerol kinase